MRLELLCWYAKLLSQSGGNNIIVSSLRITRGFSNRSQLFSIAESLILVEIFYPSAILENP